LRGFKGPNFTVGVSGEPKVVDVGADGAPSTDYAGNAAIRHVSGCAE